MLRFVTRALALLIIAAIVLFGGTCVRLVLKSRQFHAALDKQLQVVDRISDIHPTSWEQIDWDNVDFTHNVWANVLFKRFPDKFTPDEMARLQTGLNEILEQTTPDNCTDSVDRVYALMHTVPGAPREFIEFYRKAFHDGVVAHKQSP